MLSFLFLDQILTIGGKMTYVKKDLKSVELTQLNGQNNTSCAIIKDFPFTISTHSAVNSKIGPIVCGGHANNRRTQNCHRLSSDGNWINYHRLNDERDRFSMTEVSDMLVSIGGAGGPTSFEIINLLNGTSWIKRELPFSIYEHCSTKINETTILITGGALQNGQVSKKI